MVKLSKDDQMCGTCEYWNGKATRKVVGKNVECSPLGSGCSHKAVSRNAQKKPDVPGCKFWTKASTIK